MPFQTSVGITPPIGFPGDFASTNPRQFLVSGTADQFMVAGTDPVEMGRFAILDADGVAQSRPDFADITMDRLGFVLRSVGVSLITTFLGESSMIVQPGMPVEMFATGDFFAVADDITGTPVRGAAVIWDPETGEINIGAEAGAATFDTGFILLSETAVAGQVVMIGKNGA